MVDPGEEQGFSLEESFWKPSWRQDGAAQHQNAAEVMKCSSQRGSSTPSLTSTLEPEYSHQLRAGPCQQPPGHIIDSVTTTSSSSAACTSVPCAPELCPGAAAPKRPRLSPQ